ncbi:MAG TPA: TetR family transcriptional regulator [Pseudonocardiaceae bacterium]|nr:TetR family transcriptional regulator [Pseudonocardiaceae bacterium]
MTTFKRARTEEQRAARRRAILATASAMLAELPVAQVTLNELSRRVGLAKSNVLHYFESREAVLLELLDRASQRWLVELAGELAAGIDPDAPAARRGDQLAATLAASLAARPVLCDLVSAQAAVLEHNVSTQLAATHKRATLTRVAELCALVHEHVPELAEPDALRLAGAGFLVIGAVWTHARPAAATLAVYEADPELAALRIDFTATVRELLEVLIAGLLARSSH